MAIRCDAIDRKTDYEIKQTGGVQVKEIVF
jgi:hypothetical protein